MRESTLSRIGNFEEKIDLSHIYLAVNYLDLIDKKYFQLFSGMRLDLDYVIGCLTPVQMVDRPSGGPVLPRDVLWTSL